MTVTPYADAAMTYLSRGWAPVPIGYVDGVLRGRRKKSPPTGWTGYGAPYPSGADVAEWAANGAGHANVGLRMPETVVGIDVDDYDGKPGGKTITDAEAQLGALPASPRSTSRPDDPVSGIRFYRVPPGRCWADTVGQGIEVIHHGHRYAVAAPSIHPEGRTYVWLDPDTGDQRPGPAVDDLPELPAAWISELDRGSVTDRPASVDVDDEQVRQFIQQLPPGPPCQAVARLAADGWARLTDAAARHEEARRLVRTLVRLGEQGHAGAGDALASAHTTFRRIVDADKTREPDPGEWTRLLAHAVGLVKGDPTAEKDKGCCGAQPASTGPVVLDDVTPISLEDAHQVFTEWLGDDYDLDALDAVLATAAAERLDGDPLWLLLISGSGNAKTETVQALAGAGAIVTSTISSSAGLLSATPKKDRAKDATGGLLRKIGDSGLLVVKDVTSILSLNRDTRAELLAAFREIHDGFWERNVGADGGRSYTWSGRVGVIGAVTTAWDRAHDVIASMGDRFVLVRSDSTTGRQAAGRHAIRNTGAEQQMRADLAAVTTGVLAGVDPKSGATLTEAETEILLGAADLVTLARTGVDFDYRGDVIDAHAPEMPTRFAKELGQVVRGGVAIGMDRGDALRLAIRCARDSMPPLRLAILGDVAAKPHSSPGDIRRRIDKPRNTVDRQCQALHMLGVLTCDEVEYGTAGRHRWYYSLAAGVDPTVLQSFPDLSVHTPDPHRESTESGGSPVPPSNKSGKHATQVKADVCPHGMENGNEPDEFVGGRLRCPQCRAEAAA